MMRSKMRFTRVVRQRARVVRRDVVRTPGPRASARRSACCASLLMRPISSTMAVRSFSSASKPQVDIVDPLAASRQSASTGSLDIATYDIAALASGRVQASRMNASSLRRILLRSAARSRCRPPRASAMPASAADLLRRGDAEAHGERQIRDARACARSAAAAESESALLFAGDAGARDQIDEAAGIFGDQLQARVGAGGRGEEHGVEARARA